MIKRSVPRTSQPQYPVRVNRNLLPGLGLVYLPPIRKDLAGGINPSISGTVSRGAGPSGIADDFDGTSYLTFGASNNSASFTSVFVVSVPSLAATITISESSFASAPDGSQQIRISTTGGVELIRDNLAAVISGGSGHVAAGRVFCAVVSWDNTAGSGYIAVDGQIVQTAAPGTQAWATTGDFVLGRKRSADLAESAAHKTYLYGRSNQYVDSAIGARLSASPWQIFEPRKQNIYVSAASGGTTLVSASDSLTPSFTESLALLSASSVSDTATPSISESVGLAVLVSATDTLAPSVTETAEVIAAVMASDTLTPSLVEAQASFVSSALSEAFTLSLGETQGSLLSSAVTDVATVSVSESAAVLVAMVGSDTYIVSITDSAAVTTADTIAKAVTETFTLSLTEVASIVTASLWTDKAVAITVWTDKPDASTTWTVQ